MGAGLPAIWHPGVAALKPSHRGGGFRAAPHLQHIYIYIYLCIYFPAHVAKCHRLILKGSVLFEIVRMMSF